MPNCLLSKSKVLSCYFHGLSLLWQPQTAHRVLHTWPFPKEIVLGITKEGLVWDSEVGWCDLMGTADTPNAAPLHCSVAVAWQEGSAWRGPSIEHACLTRHSSPVGLPASISYFLCLQKELQHFLMHMGSEAVTYALMVGVWKDRCCPHV